MVLSPCGFGTAGKIKKRKEDKNETDCKENNRICKEK